MKQKDFFELFYANLKKELGNDEVVDSLEKLISTNSLNKESYLHAIKRY